MNFIVISVSLRGCVRSAAHSVPLCVWLLASPVDQVFAPPHSYLALRLSLLLGSRVLLRFNDVLVRLSIFCRILLVFLFVYLYFIVFY